MRAMLATSMMALTLVFTSQASAQRQVAEPRHQFEQLQPPMEAFTRCKLGDVEAYDTRVHVKMRAVSNLSRWQQRGAAPAGLPKRP